MNLLNLLQSIEVKSEYTPDVALDLSSQSPSPGPGMTSEAVDLLKKAKLQFIFHVVGDPNPVSIAPWGVPGPSKWPQFKLGAEVVGIAALGITAYGIVDLFLPRKK